MTERVLPIETDNRDVTCTWLTLPDGTVVDVDPVELFKNALENWCDDTGRNRRTMVGECFNFMVATCITGTKSDDEDTRINCAIDLVIFEELADLFNDN